MFKDYCLPFFKPTAYDSRNVVDNEDFNRFLDKYPKHGKLEKVAIGIRVTKYYISVSPSKMNYMQEKPVKRMFKAYFDDNRAEPRQEGKYLSIEVPNKYPSILTFERGAKVLQALPSDDALNLYFGEKPDEQPLIVNLEDCIHLLVAGQTGMGKSTFIHNLVLSLILQYTTNEVNLLIIDPKQAEFSDYRGLKCVRAVVGDKREAVDKLKYLCEEMDERYVLFGDKAKDIRAYNLVSSEKLPRIVVVIEEFADLLETSKSVMGTVQRLTQKARSAGIHIILATHRPESKNMSGMVKSNFIGRVSFKVADNTNSRMILGHAGAELLTGNGDGLAQIHSSEAIRFQAALVTKDEIVSVVNEIKRAESKG